MRPYPSALVEASNALGARLRGRRLAVAGGSATCMRVRVACCFNSSLCLHFRAAGTGTDTASSLLLDDTAPVPGLADICWPAMAPALQLAWLQVHGIALQALCELVQGSPVVIDAITPTTGAEADRTCIELAFDNGMRCAWMSTNAKPDVGVRTESSPASDARDRMPLSLRVTVPAVMVSRAALADLRLRDTLVLRTDGAMRGTGATEAVEVHLGPRALFQATLGGRRVTLRAPIPRPPAPSRQPHPAEPSMPPTQPPEFDDIALPVTFELGRILTTLGELRTVGPGHVFTTATPGDAAEVRIHVDGQPVGVGRLVRAGDVVGVEVLRWNAPDA